MKATGKSPVDKGLQTVRRLEVVSQESGPQFLKLGVGLLILLATYLVARFTLAPSTGFETVVVIAVVVGMYMALNIGANDVANTMGPVVGSRTLTLFWALVIAAIGDVSGAILAGGDVVSTVSKGIIDISAVDDSQTFIWAMLGALLAAAVWVNIATYVGAPVSTTHAIVGGVTGAGVAAASFSAVNWPEMARIAASWVISPVMGGLVAALILWNIKRLVLYRNDKISAAKRWVPLFVAIMAAAFSIYLIMKGLKKVWAPGMTVTLLIGVTVFFISWVSVHQLVGRAAQELANTRKAVASLFAIPLIFATGLLAFAHGANDVANAIGPLAAIISVSESGGVTSQVVIPLWVLILGGLGIAAGLGLFGPRLIRTVGEKITKLNVARAYAVALAASITVIIASALGMPVSSTHVAIGAIFGVGFLREFLSNRYNVLVDAEHQTRQYVLRGIADESQPFTKAEHKALKKHKKRKLVRRRYFFSIIAAWLVTVPLAALLGALFFYLIRGILL